VFAFDATDYTEVIHFENRPASLLPADASSVVVACVAGSKYPADSFCVGYPCELEPVVRLLAGGLVDGHHSPWRQDGPAGPAATVERVIIDLLARIGGGIGANPEREAGGEDADGE
jgi:hypothetical protein